MEELALAAPANCSNPLHAHRFTGNTALGLRREGGEALALAGIAHDARNLVTALGLCAELIAEPGVLGAGHGHHALELRSIATTAGQLVQRLSAVAQNAAHGPESGKEYDRAGQQDLPITDMAVAVRGLQALLAAVAGPAIHLEVQCLPCAGAVRLSEESLTRILMNLVRNAADAMPKGGKVRITVQRCGGGSFLWTVPGLEARHDGMNEAGGILVCVEDNGPGIRSDQLDRIFEAGFSTRRANRPWPEAPRRGLGLSIVRQLVEEAGGTVRAAASPGRGARLEIEIPLTNVTPSLPSEPRQLGERGAQ